MRRYLPIVIPTLIIFSALAILYFLSRKQNIWMRSIGALLLIVSGRRTAWFNPSRYFFTAISPGRFSKLASLHRQLKDQAILLISEPSEEYFSDKWGPPLKYIFGHDIATIRREGPELKPFLDRLWSSARSGKKPVQVIAVEPILPAVRNGLSLKPAGIFPVALTSLQNTYDQYPSAIEKTLLEIEIFDVEGTASQSPAFLKDGRLDIGPLRYALSTEGIPSQGNRPRIPQHEMDPGRSQSAYSLWRFPARYTFPSSPSFRPPPCPAGR